MKKTACLSVYLFFCWCICCSLLHSQDARPNLVFILADDLGYGDLTSYGHPYIQTPNLDQLAKEGMHFTNFYSPSPLCSPARASILTGRTPYRTDIKSWIPEGQDIYLHREEKTIATLVKEAGYQTFLAGKWHLNGGLSDSMHAQPQDHGFDKWMALHAFPLPTHKNPNNFYEDGKPLGELKGFSADLVIDKSIEYLDTREKDKPFFLYVPMAEPHSEIASPDAFNARFSSFTKGPIDLENLADRGPGEYYANITYMDDQIGRLLRYLDENNLRENTIVVFTSDNGPVTNDWRHWWEVNMYGSTGGLRGRKADLYEGGIRVPCMIRYPGLVAAGSQNEMPMHGFDFLPTFCSMLDIPLPDDRAIDGEDFSRIFSGQAFKRTKPLFWGFETRAVENPGGYDYAVRVGDWKVITDYDLKKVLLYNLKEDPYEVKELSKKYPEKVAELMALVKAKKTSIANDPLRPGNQKQKTVEFTILYTNDIESVYDPIDAYWDKDINKIGGVPQLATLIEQERQKTPLHFLFDAGDIFTGALSKKTKGNLPFDLYSSMGYDAMAIGNHEYEYGWKELLKCKQRARFPVLNANIFYENTDINYAQSYTILERQGLRVGLIGVMGEEAFYNTIFKNNRIGLEVRDPIPIVQDLVNQLEPEVDVIVVLTHQNKSAPMQSDKEVDPEVQRGFDEDYAMAGAVKGIDIILGGHSDNGLWEPVRHPATGTLIGITFGQGKQLGYMKLQLDKKTKALSLIEGKLIPVKSDQLLPRPEIAEMIQQAREKFPVLRKVVGQNEVTGYRKYYRESNLGNFIADALKDKGRADLGMINPGAIRADLDRGPITVEELINIYPFIDGLQVVEISGTQLKELLEYSLGLNYGLMQFAGLTLRYDSQKPAGQRLIEARVAGEPLEPNKKYSLATSAYNARGGDGLEVLAKGKVLEREKMVLMDAVQGYIKARQSIRLPEIGRQVDVQKK